MQNKSMPILIHVVILGVHYIWKYIWMEICIFIVYVFFEFLGGIKAMLLTFL